MGIRWLLFVLLLCQITLLGYMAFMSSCTYNEEGHLVSGLVNVRTGNFSAFAVNPPLARMVAALPLAWLDTKRFEPYSLGKGTLIRQRQEYAIGRRFLEENPECWVRYLWIARMSCMIFPLAGSILCYYWAGRCYGRFSGIIAAVLWMACPYILGHGCLIGSDLPGAVVGAVAVYCFWRWLKEPQWLEAIIVGFMLGLAELCKFTLLVFYPLFLVLWGIYRLPEWETMVWRNWLRQGVMFAVTVLVSICIINAGYLFEDTFTSFGDFRFQSMWFSGCKSLDEVPPEGANRFAGTWMSKLPIPLPANYVYGIDIQRFDFERGLPSYLRGEWADHGWWYYYLYAWAIKMPLGTWCLVALAVAVTILGRTKTVPLGLREHFDTPEQIDYSASWRDEMVVFAPGLMILIFVSSQTGFSVHSRYVIPALPFLFVWTSKVARVFEMHPFTKRGLAMATMITVMLTWSVGSSLAAYPHNLSYFNELAIILPTPADATYPTPVGKNAEGIVSTVVSAGPRNGPRHLLDSNIDWGQDVFYLKNWLDEHSDIRLDGLACYGSYPATFLGIPELPQPPLGVSSKFHLGHRSDSASGNVFSTDCFGPEPGWYALSVNYIYSGHHQYLYFLNFQPVAMAGYSIYIYHITLDEANQVRRMLGMPELEKESGGRRAKGGGSHG